MTRNGKIARLPRQLRETINQRLENNEPVEPILAWLNPLPEVQAILQDQFKGIPISKQNLYEWRKSGYHEWEFRRDFDYDAAESRADGRHLEDLTDDCLADSLGVIITARYNSLVRSWLGDTPTDEFKAKLKVMRVLVQDVSQMRRWDHSAHKVALTNAKYEDEKNRYYEQQIAKSEEKLDRERGFGAFLRELLAARKARAAASTPSMPSTSPAPQASPLHRSGDSLSPHSQAIREPSPNHPPHSSHTSPPSPPQSVPTPPEKSPAPTATEAPVSSFCIHPSAFPLGPVKPSKTTFTAPSPVAPPSEPDYPQPITENQPPAPSLIPADGDSPYPQPEPSPKPSPTPPHNSHSSPASHPSPPQNPPPTVHSPLPTLPLTTYHPQKGVLAILTNPDAPAVPGGMLWGKGLPQEQRPYRPTMCQGKCSLSYGRCTGCHRSEDEIAQWPLLTPEGRSALMWRISERRRARPA